MDNTSSTSSVSTNISNKLIKGYMSPGDNWHLNACVGSNTGSSDNSYGYAEGFKAAAELMLRLLNVDKPAAADENWGSDLLIDTLVYPICYSARHHVELALKRAVPRAWRIFKMRSPNDSHGLSEPRQNELTHSVLDVWSNLDAICEKTADPRLSVLVKNLKPYVIDIDQIDRSGQTFRYASNAEDSSAHLSGTSHINLQYFAEGYAEVCALLEELQLRLNALVVEYSMGSFTSKLNRDQLVEIAKLLPPRDQWGSPSFDEARTNIRSSYQLLSRDFQKACDIIQEKRALARFIGKSIPIDALKRDTFVRLHSASTGSQGALASLDLEERSAVFGLLQVGSPTVYPEQFESFLIPRPTDEDAAIQFDLERAPDYLARRVSDRPDLVERALSVLGQGDLLSDFRGVYAQELEDLRIARESCEEIDFAELFRKLRHKKGAEGSSSVSS
ncbi:hypothetical protein G3N95_24140 [Paraburkholderia sp. Tr-20389]|uniref:hypothetical protein n=1 Tax=Paraburkholderia sp. Tr-20389 TaxID=2703903 RepID=UPI00197E00B9|nr:hypothetical protein [Paraburkholderia sp. Tr-20389]MBN3756054.1 hypothetical protein [Paraburkholderia sp. Tr-20389]